MKVLDFGIAKLRTDSPGQAGDTQPGTFLGTPKYMSPEQCRGGSWPIDHRADIYSLGIILYEMLSGVHPFDGMGVVELLAVHLMAEPRPLREHVPDLPEYIDAAVMRAMRKQPGERFASMRELRAALGSAAIPRMPAVSMGEGDASPALAAWQGHLARPRRRLLPYALGLLLVGAGAAGAMAWRARQKRAWIPPPPPAASLPRPTPPRAAPPAEPAPPPSGQPAEASSSPGAPPGSPKAPARRARVKRSQPPAAAPQPAPAPPKKFVPPMW